MPGLDRRGGVEAEILVEAGPDQRHGPGPGDEIEVRNDGDVPVVVYAYTNGYGGSRVVLANGRALKEYSVLIGPGIHLTGWSFPCRREST